MLGLEHLISHRFRGFGELENTIPSMLSALDFGVRLLEFDVRVARCGTPMVYHDEHAPSRRGQLKLSAVMAREYDSVGGRFSTMPTLDALLQAAADHPNAATLLIDIKDAGFEEAIRALVHTHGLSNRVMYVSWLPEVLYAMAEIEPEARLCFSHWAAEPGTPARAVHEVHVSLSGEVPCPVATPLGERSGWWLKQPLRGRLLELVARNGGAVCIPRPHVRAELINYYKRQGVQLTAFSYVDPVSAQAALELGVEPLFIDSKRVFDFVI